MKREILLNNEIILIDILEEGKDFVRFIYDDVESCVELINKNKDEMRIKHNKQSWNIIQVDDSYVVDGKEFLIKENNQIQTKNKKKDHGQMLSPMPGKILKILVHEGEEVVPGTPILVMEAMKMEHTIKASRNGVIEKIYFKEGEQIQGGVELVKLC